MIRLNITKNSKFIKFLLPLLVAVLSFALSDLLLKVGNIEFELGSFLSSFFIIAIFLAFFSKIIMGYVLAKNPLGISEGIFIALAVLLAFIFGIWIFQENFNALKLIGLIFLIGGILLTFFKKGNNYKNEDKIKNKN